MRRLSANTSTALNIRQNAYSRRCYRSVRAASTCYSIFPVWLRIITALSNSRKRFDCGPLSGANLRFMFWPRTGAPFSPYKRARGDSFVPPDIARKFAVTFRIGQPFDYEQLHRMSGIAPLNVYMMLDPIAFDCLYLNKPGLDTIWRLRPRRCCNLHQRFYKGAVLAAFSTAARYRRTSGVSFARLLRLRKRTHRPR
jgi:hypothetical protein